MKLKTVQQVIYALTALFVLLFVLGYVLKTSLLFLVAIGVACVAVLFNRIFWKCPLCGKHLGRDSGEYCQHCGYKLKD